MDEDNPESGPSFKSTFDGKSPDEIRRMMDEDLPDVVSDFEDPDVAFEATSAEVVPLPFGISGADFYKFARLDLREGHDRRHLVNALSNAKRALDCRADELLFLFGLSGRAKKQGLRFAGKLDILRQLGIVAPDILKRINITRNGVEHDFIDPPGAAVQDFVDAVEMFIDNTSSYLRQFRDEGWFDPEEQFLRMIVRLERDPERFVLTAHHYDDDADSFSSKVFWSWEVAPISPLYLRLLRVYIAALMRRRDLLRGDDQ